MFLFSDNKLDNLLGLCLKLSNQGNHETGNYSSRCLLLTTSLSHLLFILPWVLQPSTAHLADKDQNGILKWQKLWIYVLCVKCLSTQFLPMSFQWEEVLVTVKTAAITSFLLLLLWPGLMFWEKNSNRTLSICNSLLKSNYLLWRAPLENSDTVRNFRPLNFALWWDY